MRSINVSTEVFAAIWKERREGEETEDEILWHILKLPPRSQKEADAPTIQHSGGLGYENAKFGVRLPEGFEIFRIHKGKEYRARASGGKWLLLGTGTTYPSLHKLSWAVVKGHENTWYNWKYKAADGSDTLINSLRDASKIVSRIE